MNALNSWLQQCQLGGVCAHRGGFYCRQTFVWTLLDIPVCFCLFFFYKQPPFMIREKKNPHEYKQPHMQLNWMKMPAAVFWCYIPNILSKCGVCLWSDSSLARVCQTGARSWGHVPAQGDMFKMLTPDRPSVTCVSHSSPVSGFKGTFKRQWLLTVWQPNPGDALQVWLQLNRNHTYTHTHTHVLHTNTVHSDCSSQTSVLKCTWGHRKQAAEFFSNC